MSHNYIFYLNSDIRVPNPIFLSKCSSIFRSHYKRSNKKFHLTNPGAKIKKLVKQNNKSKVLIISSAPLSFFNETRHNLNIILILANRFLAF